MLLRRSVRAIWIKTRERTTSETGQTPSTASVACFPGMKSAERSTKEGWPRLSVRISPFCFEGTEECGEGLGGSTTRENMLGALSGEDQAII